jgi:HAD superfamily hydrolase (TIGR01509 family)
MIKAIVFDCFGVLATDGLDPFIEKYFSHDRTLIREQRKLSRAVDAGLLPYDDFIKRLAAMADVAEEVARAQIEDNVPNDQLFRFIASSLASRFKIGLLSNAAENWLHELFTPGQVGLFNAIGLSYEIGSVKPDPRMYEVIAQRLGVERHECVMIDDKQRYCDGAVEAGMIAVRYTDYDTLHAELKSIIDT